MDLENEIAALVQGLGAKGLSADEAAAVVAGALGQYCLLAPERVGKVEALLAERAGAKIDARSPLLPCARCWAIALEHICKDGDGCYVGLCAHTALGFDVLVREGRIRQWAMHPLTPEELAARLAGEGQVKH